MKMIICVCGKSGSGKTFFSEKLAKKLQNAIHIDIDKIAHDVLKEEYVLDQIKHYFGKDIFDRDILNRKKLAKRVFQNASEMAYLKKLTRAPMEKVIDSIIEKNYQKTIILDYLFLPETKYFTKDSLKIYLDISFDLRKKQIMTRDNITEEDFLLRDKASSDYSKNLFDIVINDDALIKIIEGI